MPAAWATIAFWLSNCTTGFHFRPENSSEPKIKCPEIPRLASYRKTPDRRFWDRFPSHRPKRNFKPRIKVSIFKKWVRKCWFSWNCHQRKIAKIAIDTLTRGATTALKYTLGQITVPNAKSAYHYGEFLTDSIAGWVKNKMVAGPFKTPPLKNFRANPLMAVAQRNKVRPILNLSAPKTGSYNEAVDPHKIRKLGMSSAGLFAESLVKAGRNAKFSKQDIQDAYKQIAGHPGELQNFGFKWLGRYFYDLTTVFGSKSAPANFDAIPETVVNIVCTLVDVPLHWVHRQLDDVPVVSPAFSDKTERFTEKYEQICAEVGLPLAEACSDREKAFGPGTTGTVLGVQFDSDLMEWKISAEKANRIESAIDRFLLNKTCRLIDVQKLHGKLSDFAQLCGFMRGFRFQLVKLLGAFTNAPDSSRIIPGQLKDDLWIWKKCIRAGASGFPLSDPVCGPPITAVRFISDAAGAAYDWTSGSCQNLTKPGDRGVASVGFDGEHVFYAGGLKWPFGLMSKHKDVRGRFWGGKSAALECVGLLLPFLTKPQLLTNRYVLLYVDNISLIYAWEKKYCKNDEETSLLIRCLHVLESFLECKVYVEHVKRMSTPEAVLVDHLSRESSTTTADLQAIEHLHWHAPRGTLVEWLSRPILNWKLYNLLLKDVRELMG